jgi:hypothetical protein
MRTLTSWISVVLASLGLCTGARADLLHRYSFNDGTANDSVGGANGSLQGGATVSGGALQFNGVSAFADLPAGAIAINSYSSVTVEMWLSVPANTTGGFASAFAFGRTDFSTGLGEQYLVFTPVYGNASRAALSSDFYNVDRNAFGPRFDDGHEHFVAVTVDAVSISYFLDGGLVGTNSLAGASLANLSNDLALLGRSVYVADAFEAGSMNEFRIWNNALSAGQVAADALAGPNVVPEPGSVSLLWLGVGLVILRRRKSA